MASPELHQAALIVVLLTVSLLALVTWTLYPRKKSEWDSELESMVNGFDFELPEAVQEYNDLKKRFPDDKKTLSAALFKRAVSDIPLIRRMQAEGHGMPKLKVNDMLRDSSYLNYKYAEGLFHREIEDVQREANWLRPEEQWGSFIYQQAVDFIVHVQEQEMNARNRQGEVQQNGQVQSIENENEGNVQSIDNEQEDSLEKSELRRRVVS